MKKSIFLLFLISLFVPGILFAQNSDAGTLGDISFEFCDGGTSLRQALAQGKKSDICVRFSNSSQYDTKINIDFPFMAKDQLGNDVCSVDNGLEDYIKNINELKSLVIPANSSITENVELLFPIGLDGNIGGCLTYYIPMQDGDNGEGITIKTLLRKGFPMDFFVGSAESIQNKLKISNLVAQLDENKELILSFDIKNEGNLSSKISIDGTVLSKFGTYKKDIHMEGGIINPEKEIHISENIGTVWNGYGGLYNVMINVNSEPHFSFDISNSNIDPELLKSQIFSADTVVFQMPWLLCLVVLFLTIIIILIISLRNNKRRNGKLK